MTIDEYAATLGDDLRKAHNNKDKEAAKAALENADQMLILNNVVGAERQQFWANVRHSYFSGRFKVEEQANSSLHALMQFIQNAIQAREAKQ